MGHTRAQVAPIDRARKLRALARSPNPHEAARAAERARQHMEKFGLSEADIAEDVTTIVDTRGDDQCRLSLAHVVAVMRNCAMVVNGRGQIAFQGRPVAVQRATEFFNMLAREADMRASMPYDGNPPHSAREAWRMCFWMGFIAALTESQKQKVAAVHTEPAAASVQSSPATRTRAAPPPSVVPVQQQAAAAFDSLAGQLIGVPDAQGVIERLRFKAHAAGWLLGKHVSANEATTAGTQLPALPKRRS